MENETSVDRLFDNAPIEAVKTPPSVRVLKFAFRIEDDVKIQMPVGARILHANVQHGVPCVWALGDLAGPYCERHLQIVGTGNPLPAELGQYVGTFMMYDGALVWHVFDAGER